MNLFFHVITGIKKYIVGLIIKTSSEQQILEKEKVYLGKLNMILVQVSCNLSVSEFIVLQLSYLNIG